jgi:glycosyltransferase involved in cell wall biosynthesis
MLTGNYPGAAPEEVREGVRIRRVGAAWSYAASRLSYSTSASRCLGREPFDLWVYGFSAFSPVWSSPDLRRRCVLEFFHRLAGHAVRKRPLAGLPARIAEELTLRSHDHIVAISPSVAQQIARVRGRRHLHLVYTGIDQGCFDAPASEGDYVLYFGRLDIYNKGIDLLLEAFSRIGSLEPHIRLIVAGRGTPEQLRMLESARDALSLRDRVEFTGPVSESTKRELFGGALFVCMPSRFEGWGIVALEAGAAGKAVLGTRIPGLVDAVRDGETGLLVPPENAEALARGMRRLLDEPETRKVLGDAGRRWARRFTWDQVSRDQEAVYEQALAGIEKEC